MEHIESQISNLLRSRITGTRPTGVIECEAGEGVAGFTGQVEVGFLKRKKQDIAELLDDAVAGDFDELLLKLRDASRAKPQGPWYRCNICIDGARINFEYFWENKPFVSVQELEPNLDGRVPHFVFERRFDGALVQELTDFDVNGSLFFYVPPRVVAGKPVSPPLLEVYASLEWQSDVNNGAMDQYFGRDHEPMTGLPRADLYGATHRGLTRIGQARAAALLLAAGHPADGHWCTHA